MQTNSLQYKRTDKAIMSAFLVLCKRMGFEAMTVRNILDEALVSRTTFYQHFKDKYDVAERLYTGFMEDFEKFLEEVYVTRRVELYSMDEVNRNQSIAWYLQEFSAEHQETLDVLLRIHTEEIDIQKAFEKLFYTRYIEEGVNVDHGEVLELEASIYAAIETTLITGGRQEKLGSASAVHMTNLEEFTPGMIRAVLYAVGVHNQTRQQRLLDEIQKARDEEMHSRA